MKKKKKRKRPIDISNGTRMNWLMNKLGARNLETAPLRLIFTVIPLYYLHYLDWNDYFKNFVAILIGERWLTLDKYGKHMENVMLT